MKLTKLAQKNPVEAGAVALVVVGVLLNLDSVVAGLQANSAIRNVRSNQQTQLNLLKAEQQSAAEKAQIAEDRFKSGCLFVVAAGTAQATTLTEGQAVRDPARNAPLPVGTLVCASDGTTGLIAANSEGMPVVTGIAFTGNQEVIREAMQRSGFTSKTQIPRLK